jgi:hypothetical protein
VTGVLAVLPADTAAQVEPGLGRDWTGTDVRRTPAATAAALLDALHLAADHMWPLVIDCTDRDQAGALISALAILTARTDLAVAVRCPVVRGPRPG